MLLKKTSVPGFHVITPLISKCKSQELTRTTKKKVLLHSGKGHAEQKELHNLEEETEIKV